ncbi:unnamed protein product, partial [Mesorhabditis belari]|uniref:PDZ domain-containing protein n=1 Tax=Mesorhabditis belari TaxID=2138241 RepID=A0AAF3FC29_9BILA
MLRPPDPNNLNTQPTAPLTSTVSGPELINNIIYFSHVNKRTTYDRPGTSTALPPPSRPTSYPSNGMASSPGSRLSRKDQAMISMNPLFTTDPTQLRGEMLRTVIAKGQKGLGFTLIGNDASSKGDEFIQVKSVLAGGPAAANGVLMPGDVLVRVNQHLLLGATQADACRIFVNIPVGEHVDLEVCRGYPLIIDPANRIITESVYESSQPRDREFFDITIMKGNEGFGFTIADNPNGQRVRKIIYAAQCPNLLEGDIICELDGKDVRGAQHNQLVEMLRELPIGHRGRLTVRRISNTKNRSRTPVAGFRYGGGGMTPTPSTAPRSKTPAPAAPRSQEPTTYRANTLTRHGIPPPLDASSMTGMRSSSSVHGFSTTPNYMPLSALQMDSFNHITVNLIRKPQGFGFRLLGGKETGTQLTVGQIVSGGAAADDGRLKEGDEIMEIDGVSVEGAAHGEAVSLLEKAARQQHVKLLIRRHQNHGIDMARSVSLPPSLSPHHTNANVGQEYDVVLQRQESDGFGFVIISNVNRQGSTIGQLIEGTPAARCGRLRVGDRVLRVNGTDITGLPHQDIVNLIKSSGLSVCLTVCPDTSITPQATTIGTTFAPTYSHPTPIYGGYASMHQTPAYSTLPTSSMHTSGYKTNGFTSSQYETVPDNDEELTVELERGTRGFGFSIRGGFEFEQMPLFILRIAEDGSAAADGRLRVGDQLTAINSASTHGMTHQEAINLIKMHPTVRLRIRRRQLPS